MHVSWCKRWSRRGSCFSLKGSKGSKGFMSSCRCLFFFFSLPTNKEQNHIQCPQFYAKLQKPNPLTSRLKRECNAWAHFPSLLNSRTATFCPLADCLSASALQKFQSPPNTAQHTLAYGIYLGFLIFRCAQIIWNLIFNYLLWQSLVNFRNYIGKKVKTKTKRFLLFW